MIPEEFIENIRQEIRENGFMSCQKLMMTISGRAKEFGISCNPIVLVQEIPCDDILTVEYASWLSREYRRYSLYYFSPEGESDV